MFRWFSEFALVKVGSGIDAGTHLNAQHGIDVDEEEPYGKQKLARRDGTEETLHHT